MIRCTEIYFGSVNSISKRSHFKWKMQRSTDKSYPGDNRLIAPNSPHRRRCLAPRCRPIASWGGSTSQGSGCSPVKAVRELGSERRETVRSLSAAGVGNLRRALPSKKLLLHGAIHDDNSAYNGEALLTVRPLFGKMSEANNQG